MSKKQTIRRRGLCAFLAMAMCFGLLPATAWAVEPEDAALITAAEQDDTDVPAAAEPDGTVPDIPAGIPQALRDLAQALHGVAEQGRVCVFGSRDIIAKASADLTVVDLISKQ